MSGNFTVGGTINGITLGFPAAPALAFGQQIPGCVASGALVAGYVDFPFAFSAQPAFVSFIDESLDDHGNSWVRLLRRGTKRAAVRCDNYLTETLPWMAIEPGSYTISGKKIMAGITGSIATGTTVAFPETFPTNPMILLFIDESGDNNGGGYVWVINAQSTTNFGVYLDVTSDAVHWIAMEAGTYTHNRYSWVAGTINSNNACTGPCAFTYATPFTTDPGVIMSVHDTNNNGASYVRLYKSSPSGMSYRMNTTTELLHYVAFTER